MTKSFVNLNANKCQCGDGFYNNPLPECIKCPLCYVTIHSEFGLENHDEHLVNVNNSPRPTIEIVAARLARDALSGYLGDDMHRVMQPVRFEITIKEVINKMLIIGHIKENTLKTIDSIAGEIAITAVSSYFGTTSDTKDLIFKPFINAQKKVHSALIYTGLVKFIKEDMVVSAATEEHLMCRWCKQLRPRSIINTIGWCNVCSIMRLD